MKAAHPRFAVQPMSFIKDTNLDPSSNVDVATFNFGEPGRSQFLLSIPDPGPLYIGYLLRILPNKLIIAGNSTFAAILTPLRGPVTLISTLFKKFCNRVLASVQVNRSLTRIPTLFCIYVLHPRPT